MTDTPVDYHRSRYDAPRQKGFMGVSPIVWVISLSVVCILFAIMLFAIQKAKFQMKVMDYTDDAVKVELIEPAPPPPPPPPPPPDTPPPPKLQIRPPAIVPDAPPPPPPVNIVPTKKEDRVEVAAPAVITPDPPRPAPEPAPPRPSVIRNVAWSRPPRPTESDYPSRAMDRGISGSAVVRCTAQANGRPANCEVVSETPSGMGFGSAAVRIVQRGQLSPRTVDGAATNASFEVRVPFNLD